MLQFTRHFLKERLGGIMESVKESHEHPAITSEEDADGLIASWKHDKSKIDFPFLLPQADKDDLVKANDAWSRHCRIWQSSLRQL
jgi:hypothetical protein